VKDSVKIALVIVMLLFVVAWQVGWLEKAIVFLVDDPRVFLIMLLPTPIPDFGISFFAAFIVGMILPRFVVLAIYNNMPFRKKIEEVIPDRFEKYVARIIAGYVVVFIIALTLLIIYFGESFSVLWSVS